MLGRRFITGFTRPDYSPKLADLPDRLAVDETAIRINDEQYWLYAAVYPESNELLHTKPVIDTASTSDTNGMGIATAPNVSFVR